MRDYVSISSGYFKICLILLVIAVLMVFTFLQDQKEPYIDKDYLQALNTADRYLYAWTMRDGSIAYELITQDLKKNYTDFNDFQLHFAGVSNPHHQAFEICGFQQMSEERICFRVWLYEDYTGVDIRQFKRPKPYLLELVKVDKEKWLVNNLSK